MQKLALVALSILLLYLPPNGRANTAPAPLSDGPPALTLWVPDDLTPERPVEPLALPEPVDIAFRQAEKDAGEPDFNERVKRFLEQISLSPDSHPLIGCDCHFSGNELDSMFIKNQVGYGEHYARLQRETGVCPLWNAAIDAAESGHFTAMCAPNNVSGFGFDGRRYMSFDSVEQCMTHKTRFLAADYLTPGGRYYKGESLSAVCTHYNGSREWYRLVVDVAYGMLKRGQRAAASAFPLKISPAQLLPCRGAWAVSYLIEFSYASIIFLTIWPPIEPASLEVMLPL